MAGKTISNAVAVTGVLVMISTGAASAVWAGFSEERGVCTLYTKVQGRTRMDLVETSPCLRKYGSGTAVFGISYIFDGGRQVELHAENYNGDDFMEYRLDGLPAIPHGDPPNGYRECYGAAGPKGLLLMCYQELE